MSELSLRSGAIIAGRYRLERLLGEGGMAVVWEATHTVTRRAVAMKFLRESLRGREELRVRFHREASAASALRHPNVVEILDVFDFEEGAPVMVMELLHGETLGQKLERDEKLSLEETAALIVPVISAVGAAHALGIVHRDLKPENVFLSVGAQGTVVKVLDFGIAKLTTGTSPRAPRTEAGSMLGTPCYMAPEQASSTGDIDHRADIWSLGVILYECLSGTRPIEGDDLLQVVNRLVNAAIMPLERLAPELPHEIAATVMQMLSRDPARRPADLSEVAKLLSTYTRAVLVPFGPASTGKAWAATADEIAQAKPRGPTKELHTKAPDPRGPTLLSSPPQPSSVTVASPQSEERGSGSSRYVIWFAAGLLALTGVLIAWFRSGAGTAPNSSKTETDQVNSATAVAKPQIPSAPLSASAELAAAPPSLAAPSTPKTTYRPHPVARPLPVSAAQTRTRSDEPSTTAKPAKDEAELFSGRK